MRLPTWFDAVDTTALEDLYGAADAHARTCRQAGEWGRAWLWGDVASEVMSELIRRDRSARMEEAVRDLEQPRLYPVESFTRRRVNGPRQTVGDYGSDGAA